MGFNTLVSSLLSSVVDPLTASFQVSINHFPYSARTLDDYSKPTEGSAVPRMAIVTKIDKLVRKTSATDAGELVQANWSIVFPRPVAVDARDKFVLPGSVTGPIVQVEGVIDPATSVVYATEILLG